jgi:hypothetical protein
LPFCAFATAPASASEYAPALAVVPLFNFFEVSALALAPVVADAEDLVVLVLLPAFVFVAI